MNLVLVGWVLWHINLCRLFNTKSIFIQIALFQTIQFSMSTQINCQNRANSVLYKYRFCLHTVKFQNSSILNNSVYSVSTVSMSKTVPFQTIQFSISTLFKCKNNLIVKNISI